MPQVRWTSYHDSPLRRILAFDPSGRLLASGSLDSQIFLWEVYGDNKNYVLQGHKNGITQLCWPLESRLYSSSADKTVAIWDTTRGQRVRKYAEHTGIINCIAVASESSNIFVSGSDDKTVMVYDSRSKYAIHSFTHDYQILSTVISADGSMIYSAGIDGIVRLVSNVLWLLIFYPIQGAGIYEKTILRSTFISRVIETSSLD